MNRKEMLALAAAAEREWSLRHGDDVPYDPADEDPHPGHATDLAIWQATRSAPVEIAGPLDEEMARLVAALDRKGE